MSGDLDSAGLRAWDRMQKAAERGTGMRLTADEAADLVNAGWTAGLESELVEYAALDCPAEVA